MSKENLTVTHEEIEAFMDKFRETYRHIYNVTNEQARKFLETPRYQKYSLEMKLDFFQDSIMSNGHQDYVE